MCPRTPPPKHWKTQFKESVSRWHTENKTSGGGNQKIALKMTEKKSKNLIKNLLQFEIVLGPPKSPLASQGQTKKQLQCPKLLQLPAMTTEALSMVHNISSQTSSIPLLNIFPKKRVENPTEWIPTSSPASESIVRRTGSQDILLVTRCPLRIPLSPCFWVAVSASVCVKYANVLPNLIW